MLNQSDYIEAKREKMLEQLRKEIGSLEFEMKHIKLINIKNGTIKNLKIFTKALRIASPYILIAGLTCGTISFFLSTPFIKDEGLKRVEPVERIELSEDIGNFQMLDSNTKDVLINEQLETVFPLFSKYYKKGNNFIIAKETNIENVSSTVFFIFSLAIYECMYFDCKKKKKMRSGYTNILGYTTYYEYTFSDYIDKLKHNYPTVKKEELSKKLELKLENYNRLTR